MRAYLYAGIGIAVMGFLYWGWNAVYKSGYNAAVVDYEQAVTKVREDAVKETRAKMQKLIDEAEGVIVREEVIVETIKEIPVTKVVERIVTEQPDCRYDDLAGVFTQQAAASRGAVSGAGAATEPD